MDIKDRITWLREARGWSQTELAKKLRVSSSMVCNWEQGKRGVASDRLADLATIFGVSVDYLMGRTGEPNPASPLAPVLPPKTWPRGKTRSIPVLAAIRPGSPILAAENVIGHEEVDVRIVGEHAEDTSYFFLKVSGDSMLPARIAEGDLVLLHEQQTVENGEIAAVMVGAEEAALKRVFYRGGALVLVSDNPKYPPLVVRPEDARIVGKVVRVVIEPK